MNKDEIARVIRTVDCLMELEGQDRGLVIEMSQAMLSDILAGGLKPLPGYIRYYCDVIDSAADAERIAQEAA